MSGKWKPEYGRGRKTITSTEVKNRWNSKHYDRINVTVAKGGKDVITALAASAGLSTAAYIRHLIIADAQSRQNADIAALIGGG